MATPAVKQSNEFKIYVNYVQQHSTIEQVYPQQFYQYVTLDQWNVFIKSLNDVGTRFVRQKGCLCYYNKCCKCCGYTWIVLLCLTMLNFIVQMIVGITSNNGMAPFFGGMIGMYLFYISLIITGICCCRKKEKQGYYDRHKQIQNQCNIMSNRINNRLLFELYGPQKIGSTWSSTIKIKINTNAPQQQIIYQQNQGVPLVVQPQPNEMFVKMADGTIVKAQIIDNNNVAIQAPLVQQIANAPPAYNPQYADKKDQVEMQNEGGNNNNNGEGGMTNY